MTDSVMLIFIKQFLIASLNLAIVAIILLIYAIINIIISSFKILKNSDENPQLILVIRNNMQSINKIIWSIDKHLLFIVAIMYMILNTLMHKYAIDIPLLIENW